MAEIKFIFPYWDDAYDDDETSSPKSAKQTFSDSLEDE